MQPYLICPHCEYQWKHKIDFHMDLLGNIKIFDGYENIMTTDEGLCLIALHNTIDCMERFPIPTSKI